MLVEPKSLLIFKDAAYAELLHCIIDDHKDTVSFILNKNEEGEYKVKSSPIANIDHTDYLKNFM